MSNKLDQALDDIVSQRRKTARTNRPRRVPGKGTQAAAPVGGVKKNTKQPKAKEATKAAAPTAGGKAGESKVIVSNLPHDVTEAQIKEFFGSSVGPIKRVLLSYGPNGQSRGVATIIFSHANSAAKAAKELDGLAVDKRPIRIEILLGAKDAPAVPEAKKLSDRVTQPKNAAKPKPATETKATKAAAAAGKKGAAGRGGKAGRRGGKNAGRPKTKTAEELDQEMADYFVADNANANGNGDAAMTGGAVQPAAEGDAMADEIL